MVKPGVSPNLRIYEKHVFFPENLSDMVYFAKFMLADSFYALLHRKKV